MGALIRLDFDAVPAVPEGLRFVCCSGGYPQITSHITHARHDPR
ncbi:hypothetical protein I549_3617 [Mycobacterium avium subsp. avium 2285 (R)]|nr:hypothetical protein I549_3617 [Mycobacterium avium subsp. avium 2285 (R)]